MNQQSYKPLTAVMVLAVCLVWHPVVETGLAHAACNDAAGPGVVWQDCRKRNLILSDANLEGADLTRSNFSSTDFRGANLKSADLHKAELLRASLKGINGEGASFEGILGFRADFSEANLIGASFAKSEVDRANFEGANLTGANLSKSELGRVNFASAILTGAVLTNSNLARADFRGAEFEGELPLTSSYLYRTRIEGVDLSKATGLVEWQLEMACGDDDTALPEGMERPATWPCQEQE